MFSHNLTSLWGKEGYHCIVMVWSFLEQHSQLYHVVLFRHVLCILDLYSMFL